MSVRAAVAHHEAGHCVVSLRLGLPVRSIEVYETAEGLVGGECRYDSLGEVDCDLVAIATAAGELAERRYDPTGQITSRRAALRPGHDLALVFALVSVPGAPQWVTWQAIDRVKLEAAQMVDRDWEAIHEIARHMNTYSVLERARINELMAGRQPRRAGAR